MRGRIVRPVEDDPLTHYELTVHVTVADIDRFVTDRFVTDPRHRAALTGTVTSPLLGGQRPLESGTVQLLADDGDPHAKTMTYHLASARRPGATGDDRRGEDGGVRRRAPALGRDHHPAHPHDRGDEPGTELLAAGTLHLQPWDFLVQLTTVRTEGPSTWSRAGGLTRFAAMFVGSLWDVYLRPMLAYAPF